MNAFNIILVDDHALYRLGVKTVISEKLPEASIIGEYGSGKELFVHLDNGVIPEVIILDIIMPEMTGLEISKILKKTYPEIKIIILSSEADAETIQELLDINVDGYLSKLVVKEDLANAVKAVMEGNHFYGQDIAKILYDIYVAKKMKKSKINIFFKAGKEVALTEREKEIIRLFCEGIGAKDIAQLLKLSIRTVNNHKFKVMQKLGFNNNIDLVKYAIKENIISL